MPVLHCILQASAAAVPLERNRKTEGDEKEPIKLHIKALQSRTSCSIGWLRKPGTDLL